MSHDLSYAATSAVDRATLVYGGRIGLFTSPDEADTSLPYVVLSTVVPGLYPPEITHMVLNYVATEAEAVKMAAGDFTKEGA